MEYFICVRCFKMLNQKAQITPPRAAMVILFLAVGLAVLVMVQTRGGVLSAHFNVTTRDGRADYLAAQGWTVDPETETVQEITLPREFTGVLKDYNELQLQQGFDLRPYGGLGCTIYSYIVTDYDSPDTVLATVYLYKNRIIAGDIHSTAMDGFMHGIRKE